MNFQQIRDFVNPAVAQATGIEPVENLSMPVPVAYVPVQLVIDGELSLTSENPVQNKVIAVAIQQLDGRITAIEGQFSEGVTEAVNNWLAAHPEATTTVQDGAISYAKLDANLKGKADQIGYLQNAIGYKTKIIEGAFISASGVVTAASQETPWNLLCINLNSTDIIARIRLASVTQSTVFGFFTAEPEIGSTTYNGERAVFTNVLTVEKVSMPEACSWIAIRYNPNDYPDVLLANIVDINKGVLVQGTYSGDLNDIRKNSIYYAPSDVLNRPDPDGAYIVETVQAIYESYMQIAIKWGGTNKGQRFVRTFVSNAWTDWITFDNLYPSRPYYIATGDSLMWGAKWISKDTDPYYEIVRTNYENRIPTRIANSVGATTNYVNAAVGGAYYVGEGDNKILSQLQNIDITNAKLITIAGGRNDSSNPLGDKTSLAGDGTICGAIKEIINYIYTQNKKTQIVVVQVTPNTTDNATVFTKEYAGGWSLNSFAEKVGEMCAELNIGFVTWNGCTYLNHWVDYTGAGNNYAHPNNDEAYVQLGNFIGGKIAALYRG